MGWSGDLANRLSKLYFRCECLFCFKFQGVQRPVVWGTFRLTCNLIVQPFASDNALCFAVKFAWSFAKETGVVE